MNKCIAQLTEKLEELRSKKGQLLARFGITGDADIKQTESWAKLKEKGIGELKTTDSRAVGYQAGEGGASNSEWSSRN